MRVITATFFCARNFIFVLSLETGKVVASCFVLVLSFQNVLQSGPFFTHMYDLMCMVGRYGSNQWLAQKKHFVSALSILVIYGSFPRMQKWLVRTSSSV